MKSALKDLHKACEIALEVAEEVGNEEVAQLVSDALDLIEEAVAAIICPEEDDDDDGDEAA